MAKEDTVLMNMQIRKYDLSLQTRNGSIFTPFLYNHATSHP